MTQPFALELTTTKDRAFDLSEHLDETQALSVSLFDAPNDHMTVQALYQTEMAAKAAKKILPANVITQIRQLPDEDWVSLSQSSLAPVKAGRFCVHGAHDRDQLSEGITYPIEIEAGLAFGTGHHGTTAGCLVIFDELLRSKYTPKSVLDLGCGAGVLAIAAAMTTEADILASDIDADAVTVTNENAANNQVGDKVQAVLADGFDSPVLRGRTFDLIFANILAGPLMELAEDITRALAPQGYVILSGILDSRAEAVIARFTASGLHCQPFPSLNGWTSILAQKSA